MTEVTNDEMSHKECQECRREASFLRSLRIDDSDRLLCTSCILRQHPGHFCPVCFQFYDGEKITATSETSDYVACSKPPCASVAHSDCVGDASAYVCPTCKDLSFSFCPLAIEDIVLKQHHPAMGCASMIAADNLKKASVTASAVDETKVEEVAEERKRAREAMQDLENITEREHAEKKQKGKEKVDDDIASSDHTHMDTDLTMDEGDVDIDGGDGDEHTDD